MFAGDTFQAEDFPRLSGQLKAVRDAMIDGEWRTLGSLQRRLAQGHATQATTQSISARLRDLRKETFGSYTVERQKVTGSPGLFQYRVLVPEKAA